MTSCVDNRDATIHFRADFLRDGIGILGDDRDRLPCIETVDQVIEDLRADVDGNPGVHRVLNADDKHGTENDQDIEHEHGRTDTPPESLIEHAGDNRRSTRRPA